MRCKGRWARERSVRLCPAWMDLAAEVHDVGRYRLDVLRIADPVALMDKLGAVYHRKMKTIPYWAQNWPGAIALGAYLSRIELRGVAALELGCGTGIAGVAAAMAGARVTFTDLSRDALRLASANHYRNLGTMPRAEILDWREPSRGLSFPVVIAADVIFDKDLHEPLFQTIDQVLAPGGTLYISEPGRWFADGVVEQLPARGFTHCLDTETIVFDEKEMDVWIHGIHRPARRWV